jgi:GTP cyclohydrolase II
MVGEVEQIKEKILVRVHDQCQTSEVFGSLRCDCKEQLDFALQRIQDEGAGIVLYLPQEGRGIGLANKVAAYAAQQMFGLDTVDGNRHLGLPDDCREYSAVKDILQDLHITSIRLMTNNPRKMAELASLGVHVCERVPIETTPNSEFSSAYVKAKKERMDHMFS